MSKKIKIETPKAKVDVVNGDTLFNMFDYLCSRINFSKSALDGEAITCMNNLFIELRKDTRIIKMV